LDEKRKKKKKADALNFREPDEKKKKKIPRAPLSLKGGGAESGRNLLPKRRGRGEEEGKSALITLIEQKKRANFHNPFLGGRGLKRLPGA